MQITIDGQTFSVRKEPCLVGTNTEDSWLVICDASGEAIGHAMNEKDATAICEQIAWRRKVDGKVDDSVDEQLTKGAGVDEKQGAVDREREIQIVDEDPNNIQLCMSCTYFLPSEKLCIREVEIPRKVQKCTCCSYWKNKLTKEHCISCLDCVYYKTFYANQSTTNGAINKVGYCSVTNNQYTTVPENYSCNRAKRRTT